MSRLPVFIEILNSAGSVHQRVKVEHLPATLGRAYDNDVILDDPFTAAHHARLERNQLDEIILTDLDSHNGLYVGKQRVEFGAISGRETFTLGRTDLRIRPIDFAVADEARNAPSYRYTLWPWAILCMLVLSAMDLFKAWIYTSEPSDATSYIASAIGSPIACLLGAGIMALIGKLFYGQARFVLQLLIGAVFSILANLVATAGHLASFSFNLPWVMLLTQIVWAAVAAASLYVAFRVMGNQRKWLLATILGGLTLVCLVYFGAAQHQKTHYLLQKFYMSHILPDSWRLSGERSPSEFINQAATLKEKIDARREPKDPD